jgi:hypothetical protein
MTESITGTGKELRGEDNGQSGLKSLKAQRVLSLMIMALGAVLLVFMITVEDEPGALPLALVVGGTAWFLLVRRRVRSINPNEVS